MDTVTNNDQCNAGAPCAAESAKPETATPRDYIRPAVDISETETGYMVETEMPGVNKGGLSVTLEGGVLTLEGRRQHYGPAGAGLLHRESTPGDYRRSFQLDPAIDSASITARLEQGVLTVLLPKAEASKPHKITVA